MGEDERGPVRREHTSSVMTSVVLEQTMEMERIPAVAILLPVVFVPRFAGASLRHRWSQRRGAEPCHRRLQPKVCRRIPEVRHPEERRGALPQAAPAKRSITFRADMEPGHRRLQPTEEARHYIGSTEWPQHSHSHGFEVRRQGITWLDKAPLIAWAP